MQSVIKHFQFNSIQPSKLTSTVFSLLKWTHTSHILIRPGKFCDSKIMEIPSLGKEFPVKHRDHRIALSIQ